MKIRIALIAACAAALVLPHVDVALAQSLLVNTTHSNIRGHGKKIAKPPRPSLLVNPSHSNIRHPGEKQSALQDVSTTRGRVLPGKGKSGPAAISDQASGGVLTKR